MIPEQMRQKLSDYLFHSDEYNVYLVVDGAAVPGILEAIKRNEPEHCCLLSGKLSTGLADLAPYLIKFNESTPLLDWLLDKWGQCFGIIAIAPKAIEFKDIKKHFRQLLMVSDTENEVMYFRYYDPVVMRRFLPSCQTIQLKDVFNQIKLFIMEGESEESAMCYWINHDHVVSKESFFVKAAL